MAQSMEQKCGFRMRWCKFCLENALNDGEFLLTGFSIQHDLSFSIGYRAGKAIIDITSHENTCPEFGQICDCLQVNDAGVEAYGLESRKRRHIRHFLCWVIGRISGLRTTVEEGPCFLGQQANRCFRWVLSWPRKESHWLIRHFSVCTSVSRPSRTLRQARTRHYKKQRALETNITRCLASVCSNELGLRHVAF